MTEELRRLDVDADRRRSLATVILRRHSEPLLVLGSSQPAALVRPGVHAVRRRGGGGAVLMVPDESVWIDLWIPTQSSLADRDVGGALERAGAIFKSALSQLGADHLEIAGKPTDSRGAVICFDKLGAGELTHEGAKLLGLAAWRCREGTLFQTAAYHEVVPDVARCLTPIDRTVGIAAATLRSAGVEAATGSEIAASVRAVVSLHEGVAQVESPLVVRRHIG